MPEQTPSDAPQPTPWGLPLDDLDAGVGHARDVLLNLRGARVLVTGGTGFLGSWLVGSLLRANALLNLDLNLVVLTRNPDAVPIKESPEFTFLRGDVRTFPDPGAIDVIVHGAATSSAPFGQGDGDPRRMAATIVEGTQAILDTAVKYRARVLFLSSGAVYGPQVASVDEQCLSAPDSLDPRSAYGQAKRLAETLCVSCAQSNGLPVTIARLFAFVGPRIPLDAHYAAGNFLRDVLAKKTITVQGDGQSLRSYLYTGDLPEWCWTVLFNGRPGVAYNVGSSVPVTIAELATQVSGLGPTAVDVDIQGQPGDNLPQWYVPCTTKSEEELGLSVRTSLDDALRKTYSWLLLRGRGAF